MNKTILLIFSIFAFQISFAQKFEKIKALKTAFITDKLDLTASEAEKFWPVYNQYEKELHQLQVVERMSIMEEIREQGGLQQMSEKEAQVLLTKVLDLDEKIHSAEKNKFLALRKVISPQKLLRLFKAEDEFKRDLFRRLQEHRDKGRP